MFLPKLFELSFETLSFTLKLNLNPFFPRKIISFLKLPIESFLVCMFYYILMSDLLIFLIQVIVFLFFLMGAVTHAAFALSTVDSLNDLWHVQFKFLIFFLHLNVSPEVKRICSYILMHLLSKRFVSWVRIGFFCRNLLFLCFQSVFAFAASG